MAATSSLPKRRSRRYSVRACNGNVPREVREGRKDDKFLKAARAKDDAPEAEIAKLRELLAKHNLAGAQEPGDIEWNFTKFLIDHNGNIVKRFHPTTTPETIDAEIATLLNGQS